MSPSAHEDPSTDNPSAQEKTLAEQASPQYECLSCGYVYEPEKGDSNNNVAPGTEFVDLPATWKCPVCGVRRTQFRNIGAANAPSGFQENLTYGFGVNTLTPNQKNLLIFGALALGVLFFLSLYGLR
ncbi:rubredoxin [Spirulina major CS-329]|jgi:rubredoxin|uniref:rubredoxin n=1 Tax=Spirulina TaxID=1154 RepID=UPI0023302F7D|nr:MULTISPECIES: rubredoxin [Spirulina]MDB9495884.1 rubredoxin [Spirulina subsalsa CS-330]MDB9502056.1 rubredoxin [Spirulina major CS-329]